jgi:2-methylcitrate dehydratase PrpD
VAAHLRDQDDLHFDSLSHPGGIVWTTVAACALERDVRFGEAVAAAAFGYELMVRLAEAAGAAHRQRWHVTTTAGVVGAAGAAARIFGTDPADAVAHGTSVAGGAAHAIVERTATRFLHRGHAVTSGIACARADKPGGRRILDDGRGTFVLEYPERLTAARSRTALEETGFRLRPSTGFAHAALDAAATLDAAGDIEHVNVEVSTIAASLASNPHPQNDDEAWWSIEHAVAEALGIDIEQVEVEGTTDGWAATVAARLRDGRVQTASARVPLGHPDRPASNEDLCAKWARLTGSDGSARVEQIASADDYESFANVLSRVLGDRLE